MTTWFAPGRVNLIGEHTDYNDGFVLPFALEYGVRTTAERRDDGRLRLRSVQHPEEGADSDVVELRPGSIDGWAGYPAGVVWALGQAGADTASGFEITVDGDVPLGAGLSSSAALECSVAGAVAELTGFVASPVEVALLAQRAENDYVGMPCGAMDQLASMLGEAGHVVFLDIRSLEPRRVPFDPAAHDLAVVLVDTCAPHSLKDGEYASRRAACEQAARTLGVPALRDVSIEDLDGALARLDDEVVRRRVRHVVTENQRVLDTVALLEAGRLREIGRLLNGSHASMRDDYEITVPEVDTAVETALAAGALGARMTGGGFGGSIIALVPARLRDDVEQAIVRAFADRGFAPPEPLRCAPAQGAHPLD